MIKVLFVCMGNICRSPTAEGVFRHVVESRNLQRLIHIESAGTHAYHVGEPPDSRATQCAAQRGVDLSSQKARRVSAEDFLRFDYVIAMDRNNQADLAHICPEECADKLKLFLEFAPDLGQTDVPDPYYGGPSGFERVIDMIEVAADGLLAHIEQAHRPRG